MKIRNWYFIRQIRNFFCIMSLALRRLEEYSSVAKSYYKTKRDLLSSISDAIGKDWKGISEIDVNPNKIKIVRYYER